MSFVSRQDVTETKGPFGCSWRKVHFELRPLCFSVASHDVTTQDASVGCAACHALVSTDRWGQRRRLTDCWRWFTGPSWFSLSTPRSSLESRCRYFSLRLLWVDKNKTPVPETLTLDVAFVLQSHISSQVIQSEHVLKIQFLNELKLWYYTIKIKSITEQHAAYIKIQNVENITLKFVITPLLEIKVSRIQVAQDLSNVVTELQPDILLSQRCRVHR